MDKSNIENLKSTNKCANVTVLPPGNERADINDDRTLTTSDDFAAWAGKIDFLEAQSWQGIFARLARYLWLRR